MKNNSVIFFETLENFKSIVFETNHGNYIFTGSTSFKSFIKNLNNKYDLKLTYKSLCDIYLKNISGIKITSKTKNDIRLDVAVREFFECINNKVNELKEEICLILDIKEKVFDEKIEKMQSKIIDINNEQNNKQDNIFVLRNKLGEIMDHYNNKSAIYLLNDGTGSGKTYNIFNTYIEQTPTFSNNVFSNQNIHNLIYVVPQKIQMMLNPKIYEHAYQKNIPFLQIKSFNDLVDLDMMCWSIFNLEKGRHISNLEFFDILFSTSLNKERIQNKINSLYKEIQNFKNQKEGIENEDINEDEENIEKTANLYKPNISKTIGVYVAYKNAMQDINCPEKEQNELKNNFHSQMYILVRFLIESIKISEMEKIISNVNAKTITDKIEDYRSFFYYIISHCAPLEIAKYRPSIICMTADKSAFNQLYGNKRSDGSEYQIVNFKGIDEIISGIKSYTGGEITKNVNLSEDQKIDFLKNKFFKKEKNIYQEKNISFSFIIDEEHIFSNIEISKYNSVDMLGDKRKTEKNQYNIIDSLAAIYRLMNNYVSGDKGLVEKLKKDKKLFIEKLIKNIYEQSSYFSKIQHKRNENLRKDPVYDLFSKFSNNSVHLKISSNNADYLHLICTNIYAYSPKTMLQIETLKDIKLTLSSTGIFIENINEDENQEEDVFSLYDLFQLILIVLFSLKDIPSSVQNSLDIGYEDAQNKCLKRICNVCKENKSYLISMFDSTHYINKETVIDDLIVYFMSKIMFSVVLMDDFKYKDIYNVNNEYISADLKIILSKEMFEVSILRMLQGKKNKVFLLSATRGYNEIYSGQYNIDFFQKYKDKFNKYEVITRKDNLMSRLTEERKKEREVNVNLFKSYETAGSCETYQVNSVSSINKLNVVKKQNNLTDKEINAFMNIYNLLIKKVKGEYNYYKRIELENLVYFIALHSVKRENAMILTRSNNYLNFLIKNKFLKDGIYYSFDEGEVYKEVEPYNKNKVFEFVLPVDSSKTFKKTRIILFNANLGREPNIDRYFTEDDNTNIIFISSFKSAGTGVNFCINDTKDFDAISFTNNPYYTEVKNKNGYNNVNNLNIKLKNAVFKNNLLKLQEIDNILSSDESYGILLKEHLLEILKTIEQAIGRVERRDSCNFKTNINFIDNDNESFFKTILTQYYYCNNTHKDLPVINNKSVLNKSMYNVAEFVINEYKLAEDTRSKLEEATIFNDKIVKNFFENDYRHCANKFRNGDKDYKFFPHFNSLIRNITSLENWPTKKREILLYLKDNSPIDIFNKIKKFLNACVIDLEDIVGVNYKKCLLSYNEYRNGYTDITKSNNLYNEIDILGISPLENIVGMENLQKEQNCSKNYKFIPMPYFGTILKGNVGEKIIKFILDENGIDYKKEDFYNDKFCSIYEFFDFIIETHNKIICIDAKSWRFLDNKKGDKLVNSIDKKIEAILSIFNKPVEFYYINTDPQNNGNGLQGINININQKKSHFFNLFINLYTYNIPESKKQNIKLKKERLTLNQDFKKLIKGA